MIKDLLSKYDNYHYNFKISDEGITNLIEAIIARAYLDGAQTGAGIKSLCEIQPPHLPVECAREFINNLKKYLEPLDQITYTDIGFYLIEVWNK